MSFSSTQIRKLQRDVKTSDIRTREINGRELCYIEGWHAVAEANRIFGFDAWNRETIESRCILSRDNRGSYLALYAAKVRVTVRADGDVIVREGVGTGEGQASTAGEAHDKAIKTAETDATKRALATFGKPFGLSLYLGNRRAKMPLRTEPDIERRRTLQRLGANGRYYVSHSTNRPADLAGKLKNSSAGDTASSAVNPAPAPGAANGTSPRAGAPADAVNADDGASKSTSDYPLLIERPHRKRDAGHLRYVASQPCLICSRTPSDAHHLKFAQPRATSRKVSDEFTVPLCRVHHRQLHDSGNEITWWMDLGIDPLPIAQDLWQGSQMKEGGDPAPHAAVSSPSSSEGKR